MALWTSISSVHMTIPKWFLVVQINAKLNTFFEIKKTELEISSWLYCFNQCGALQGNNTLS